MLELVAGGNRPQSVEVELGDTENAAVLLASLDPLRSHDGDVCLDGLLPGQAATLSSDKVRGVDADAVDNLGTNAVDGGGQRLFSGGGHDARGDRNTAEVRHLVGAHDDLVGAKGTGGGPQDEVESIIGIDRQTTDLGAVHLQGARDIAGLLAVAVQGEGDEVGGG